MANPTVDFIFDFGSPNAYLSHRVIPAIETRTGAKFRYVPALLGGIFKATGNRSPAEAFGGIKNKLAYEGLETRRFAASMNTLLFAPNPAMNSPMAPVRTMSSPKNL